MLDLPARVSGGVFYSVWRPSPEERAMLAAGADIEVAVAAEDMPPISLNIHYEEGSTDADMSSMRSGDDRSAGEGQRPEDCSGSPRIETGGPGSVQGRGLVDGATDGGEGDPGVAGGEPGGAREDLPGTQISLNSPVKIIDGDGVGLVGRVTDVRKSPFGHTHVSVDTENREVHTLLDKIAPL